MSSASKHPRKPAAKKSAGKAPGIPDRLEEFFGPEGPLAATLPGYEMRREQVEVAEAIERAIDAGLPCLAEAGTGVGKTLAYLVPAVRAALRGKKTVISTHTITLQNQLIEKDIPLVLSLFGEDASRIHATLMKGRGNFLCLQEFDNARGDLFLMADPLFRRVQRWAARTECTGDVADLPFTFSAWNEISSNIDTCRVQDCVHYEACHYYKMRWAAADSNIIVVNHALLLSDLALRATEPQSGIIPEYDHLVIDEAHHLEDVATKTFGVEFGSRRLTNVLERIKHIRGLDLDEDRLQTIEQMNTVLFAPFAQVGRAEFVFEEALPQDSKQKAEEAGGITCNAIAELQKTLLEAGKDNEEIRERVEGMARLCGRAREELQRLFEFDEENVVRWAEISQAGRSDRREARVTLHLTPVSISGVLQEALWSRMAQKKGSVILLSATLANSGGFSYQRARLGVPDEAVECVVGSPFDFKSNAMLYVPGHLPAPPKSPVDAYTDRIVEEVARLLRLTEGRAFLLFTSRAMLNNVYDRLDGMVPFPLFKQGDMPPARLVEAFKESGNGCLLGVQTFWEGVDIQGEALSCVIIDRLPFAVPDSPVTRARTKAIEEAGGDWFQEYSIPKAQIRLKQGFGRLIRTHEDRGIVCILDTRMITRDYGAEFVRYLPPASRASKWRRVERFWRGELAAPGAAPDAIGGSPLAVIAPDEVVCAETTARSGRK